jgi:hypothetical protein
MTAQTDWVFVFLAVLIQVLIAVAFAYAGLVVFGLDKDVHFLNENRVKAKEIQNDCTN